MVPAERANTLRQINDNELQPYVKMCLETRNIASMGCVSNYYLANGARFYNDISQRREYATPEDDSFLGTTANEMAGDQLMADIATLYTEHTGKPIQFIKRVIDDNVAGCGYHVSYAANAERVSISEERLGLYGVFAATRAVLFGAGALLPHRPYAIAQKSLALNDDFNAGTTGTKPVVNLRREPLADPNRFVRVHDTSGDPTMSPWATRVKLGAGSIVLRLIENGYSMDHLRFRDSLYKVARRVGSDAQLIRNYPLKDGHAASALDVQSEIVRHAKKLAHETAFSDEEAWTLEEWERAIFDLRTDPRLTADRIEWVMRREVLNRLHERHGWGWDSEQLRYKDRQFSDISVNGIALALRQNAWADYMPPESLIKDRITTPPTTTRARVRGAFIRMIQEHGYQNTASADWGRLVYNAKTYYLNDPYESQPDILKDRSA